MGSENQFYMENPEDIIRRLQQCQLNETATVTATGSSAVHCHFATSPKSGQRIETERMEVEGQMEVESQAFDIAIPVNRRI